jgi:hypothetical protein
MTALDSVWVEVESGGKRAAVPRELEVRRTGLGSKFTPEPIRPQDGCYWFGAGASGFGVGAGCVGAGAGCAGVVDCAGGAPAPDGAGAGVEAGGVEGARGSGVAGDVVGAGGVAVLVPGVGVAGMLNGSVVCC